MALLWSWWSPCGVLLVFWGLLVPSGGFSCWSPRGPLVVVSVRAVVVVEAVVVVTVIVVFFHCSVIYACMIQLSLQGLGLKV